MKIFSVQCPNCGAGIKVNDNTVKVTCEFCNSSINISRLIPNYHPAINKTEVKKVIEQSNKSSRAFLLISILLLLLVPALFEYAFMINQNRTESKTNQYVPPQPTMRLKAEHILDLGNWGEHYYFNDELGWMVNVPKGWSVTKNLDYFYIRESATWNEVEIRVHKYTTAEARRKHESEWASSLKKNEVFGTEELAGYTFLTYSYDREDDYYSKKHYFMDVVWEENDWEKGDDVLEIECEIRDASTFDLSKIITKIDLEEIP